MIEVPFLSEGVIKKTIASGFLEQEVGVLPEPLGALLVVPRQTEDTNRATAFEAAEEVVHPHKIPLLLLPVG